MPIKRPPLINNEIYHIVTRGVSDSLIFKRENDYYRAIFSLYEFNTVEPVLIRKRRKLREQFSDSFDDRDLIVEILAFCFMPNHIHLLLRQIKEGGISQFMRKFGAGYAAYFNKKYNRQGHLFQGRFRAVHIKDDNQLKIVFAYIHSNPISLVEAKWKEGIVENPERAIKFLENYRWSSYLDYIGKRNFPSITERAFFLKIMGSEASCGKFVKDLVEYKKRIQWGEVGLD